MGLIWLNLLWVGAASAKEEYIIQHSLKLSKRPVYEAVFSPDNRFLVTLNDNHQIQVWSGRSGKLIKVIPTGRHKAITLITHPQEPRFVTGGEDHHINIWDGNKGTNLGTLRGHIGDVTSIVMNKDGDRLISGSTDGAILVWDLNKLVLQNTIRQAHAGSVNTLDLHYTGKLLASGGSDKRLKVWQVDTGRMVVDLASEGAEISQVKFHFQGQRIAVASQDKSVRLWKWQEKFVETTLKGHDGSVTSLDFHQNGRMLVTGSKDGTVRLWDLDQNQELFKLKMVEGPVSSVHLDLSGNRIAAATEKGFAQIWELGPSAFLGNFQAHQRTVDSLDFTANGKYLLSTANDKMVRIWEVGNKKQVKEYPMGNHRVQQVLLLPGDQQFLTAGADSQIGVWETQSGRNVDFLRQHQGKVNSLALHPAGKTLLSGGADRRWVLWDIESLKVLKETYAHEDQIMDVAFAHDGTLFATASRDKTIKIWRFPEGHPLETIQLKRPIEKILFHPDENTLLVADNQSTLHFFSLNNLGEATPTGQMEGHNFLISQMHFSPDAKTVITSSLDKTVRLWEPTKMEQLRILSGEDHPITTSALTDQGDVIAAGTSTGEIILLSYPYVIGKSSSTSTQAQQQSTTAEQQEPVQTAAAEVQRQQSIQAYEQERYDEDLEEVEAQRERTVYTIVRPDNSEQRKKELRGRLNSVLKKRQFCQDFEEMEKSAYELVLLDPNDRTIYFTLLHSAVLHTDIKNVFLLAKLGLMADFKEDTYDYQDSLEVTNYFHFWMHRMFDQGLARLGNEFDLRLKNCNGALRKIVVPDVIRNLDIPDEFLKKSISIPRFIELQDYIGLTDLEYFNRLSSEIARRQTSNTPYLAGRAVLTKDFVTPRVAAGMFQLSLIRYQNWGKSARIPFELREGGNPWQTYTTDIDHRKIMQLPVGEYYLKVGGKIRKAFSLNEGEAVVVELDNEL